MNVMAGMERATVEYARQVAAESEAAILSRGGKVLSTLPYLDRSGIRSQAELIGRSLALNAIIDLNFKVPAKVVREWIDRQGVSEYLTDHESSLLRREPNAITEQEKADLGWSLDALWAMMWAGSLFDKLEFWSPIPDSMYAMCPHLREGEGSEKFADRMRIRSFDEIYRALDLHYRLHWYALENQLRDEFGVFDLSRFLERRKALEWLLSPQLAWDDVSLNT